MQKKQPKISCNGNNTLLNEAKNTKVVKQNDKHNDSVILKAKNALIKKITESDCNNNQDFLKKQLSSLKSLNDVYKRFKTEELHYETNDVLRNLFNSLVSEIESNESISDEAVKASKIIDDDKYIPEKIKQKILKNINRLNEEYRVKIVLEPGNIYYIEAK
jgi:hypothetical protein